MNTITAWVIFAVIPVQAFILSDGDHCAVPAPCTCGARFISCAHLNLSTFPNIFPFSKSMTQLQVLFNNNRFTNMPSDVFRNVSTANATYVQLMLASNYLSTISDSAFDGIDNITTYLDLTYNRLTRIPVAISKLVNLETLLVFGNAITTIDASILVKIQQSLRSFSFSTGSMSTWPDELHILRWLSTLAVDDVNFRTLPDDAFRGFETSLQQLWFDRIVSLERIPEEICHLKHLHLFSFSGSATQHSYHDLCHEPLTEMTALLLNSNGMSIFPDGLFTIFPSLTSIDLSLNRLRFIPSEYVPTNNNLTELLLQSNQVSNIAHVVNAFPKLKKIYLQFNQIYAIGRNDLAGLFSLEVLYLTDNPIQYINADAFENQRSTLTDLSLYRTDLLTIPTAVTTLSQMLYFSFSNHNGTECSCDTMAHLRSWNAPHVHIYGYCEYSHESLNDFIVNSLPQCPP